MIINNNEKSDYDIEELNLTENDSLEAYHQKIANNSKEEEKLYHERQNLLRDANRSGTIFKLLSKQQKNIFKLTFEYNQIPQQIALKLNTSNENIYHQLEKITEKLKNYFK